MPPPTTGFSFGASSGTPSTNSFSFGGSPTTTSFDGSIGTPHPTSLGFGTSTPPQSYGTQSAQHNKQNINLEQVHRLYSKHNTRNSNN